MRIHSVADLPEGMAMVACLVECGYPRPPASGVGQGHSRAVTFPGLPLQASCDPAHLQPAGRLCEPARSKVLVYVATPAKKLPWSRFIP